MSVEVVTFGCRLNACESEVIRREARAAGIADTVVVNTCAVTAEAVRQARQTIRRLAREQPGSASWSPAAPPRPSPKPSPICPRSRSSSATRTRSACVPGASVAKPWRAPPSDLAAEEKIAVNDIMTVKQTAAHLVDGLEGRARAFVQVQNGCDHRCTFCIIPYGRGNSRSVPMGEVVREVRRLTERGYRELVLTGVDLTSYGAGLRAPRGSACLVKQILKHVPELERLRLSSIDSVEADRDLLDAFASNERLMPHLHLSLQAGDDLILKRMKRRHLRADAIAFCAQVRRLRPDVVFGADLIAGFPTESEDMFARSLALIDECGLTHLHVFPFSPRPGTPAARMPQLARAAGQGPRPPPARKGRRGAAGAPRCPGRPPAARIGRIAGAGTHRAFHADPAVGAGRARSDRRARGRRA